MMTLCETATWAHRSFGLLVAHLVSLHISYSHRTPREGVRSLSGCATCEQLVDALHIPMFTHACRNNGKNEEKDL
jgi:hypothetical protein